VPYVDVVGSIVVIPLPAAAAFVAINIVVVVVVHADSRIATSTTPADGSLPE